MSFVLSFLPVLLFLMFLFLLDNFNLVRIKTLILCLLWGVVCTAAAYFLNSEIAYWGALDFDFLSHHVAPVIEETLKALMVFYLISKKKIGFMIDAAIYGFAIGAGFSLMENIWYLFNYPRDYYILMWVIRGFGTAIMHGGTTSILAILFIGVINQTKHRILAALPGLFLAIVLHTGFNYFPLNPLLQTLLILMLLPVVFILVFRLSNVRLRHWLEIELNSEVEILNMIRKGEFSSTKAGTYLLSLKERFSSEIIVDMYCYISLYLELSIKAKCNLMLKETGFPVRIEKELQPKLQELALLRKKIGSLGELALKPLIRMNYRNLWKLNQLI